MTVHNVLTQTPEPIRNLRIPWSAMGFVLAGVLGIFTLYQFFHEDRAALSIAIIGESNVIDIHKPLEDLSVYFRGADIQKENRNLRILRLQIANVGEVNILQSHYDSTSDWGIVVQNALVIDGPRLVGSSDSTYYRGNRLTEMLHEDSVLFPKLIMDKGAFFTIELLLLHDRNVSPQIEAFGKISGVREIEVQRGLTPEASNESLGRVIFYLSCGIVVLFLSLVYFITKRWRERSGIDKELIKIEVRTKEMEEEVDHLRAVFSAWKKED